MRLNWIHYKKSGFACISEILKPAYKTGFWLQNNLFNLCACREIKKGLLVVKKLALNVVINPFWYTNILFDSDLFV